MFSGISLSDKTNGTKTTRHIRARVHTLTLVWLWVEQWSKFWPNLWRLQITLQYIKFKVKKCRSTSDTLQTLYEFGNYGNDAKINVIGKTL